MIVGYKDAAHLKGAIGALVLGYYEDGKLRYAGRSGTGYTMETARDLWKKLQPLRRDKPAFGKLPDEERGRKGIWVEPKLVAEVDVRAAGPRRAMCATPCSRGCARTSPPREVVREMPMPTQSESQESDQSRQAESARRAKRESRRRRRR